ncbi:MAG: hypothetical protein U0821_06430 [Chloroflexota bacterium]
MSGAVARWGLVLVVLLGLISEPVAHAQADPAQRGRELLAEELLAPGPRAMLGTCRSGRNGAGYDNGGITLRVTGRCADGDDSPNNAQVAAFFPAVNLRDGEVSIEAKVIDGAERTRIQIAGRADVARYTGYLAYVEPLRGVAGIRRSDSGPEGSTLVEKSDLGQLAAEGEWLTLALRVRGNTLWLLVNGKLLVSATDGAFGDGIALIQTIRTGSSDDDRTSAAVFRNLRVHDLADTSPQRASRVAGEPTPLGPPTRSDAAFADAARPDPCPSGRNSTESTTGGLRIHVTGKCVDDATTATIGVGVRDYVLRDGEVHIELRVEDLAERMGLEIWFREQESPATGYVMRLAPSTGYADIVRSLDGDLTGLIRRTDLRDRFEDGEWINIAVRVDGPRMWVLLGEETVLAAIDPSLQAGGVTFVARRFGSPDEEQRGVLSLRGLKLSPLAVRPAL